MSESATSTQKTTVTNVPLDAEGKALKPCCACPETKKTRDKCIMENGEENCKELIEDHFKCMRNLGFKQHMKIQGYTFIVTGGASGLGEQVVRSLVDQGAFVSIFDINVTLGSKLAEELGHDKCYFPDTVDVTSESQVDNAIKKTKAKFFTAKIGGAILCSGILTSPSNKGYGPDDALTSYKQFEHIIKVNLLGTFCVAQKVSEELLKNEPIMDLDGERGIIITVSSILGLDGTLVGYGTSKAAIAGLTLPLARELAPFGIRIMSIAPGPFDTPIVNRASSKAPVSLFPARFGKPSEFADLVIQVIKQRMLNGSVIRLDGALHA